MHYLERIGINAYGGITKADSVMTSDIRVFRGMIPLSLEDKARTDQEIILRQLNP
jgi:hypothetical protein